MNTTELQALLDPNKQYALRKTLCGYVLTYRERVPDESPGMFKWSRWKRAGLAEAVDVQVAEAVDVQVAEAVDVQVAEAVDVQVALVGLNGINGKRVQ